jgi:hypothetical protein
LNRSALSALVAFGSIMTLIGVVTYNVYRAKSDVRKTRAGATKDGADAASILQQTLADSAVFGQDLLVQLHTASLRLAAVLRLCEEIPDHAPFGSIRARIIEALSGVVPPIPNPPPVPVPLPPSVPPGAEPTP